MDPNVCPEATHRAHKALGDNSSWTIVIDYLDETSPESINVLSLDRHDFEAVTFESLGEIVSLEVLRGVTSDSDVIVVNEDFDVKVLSDGQPSSFCIVALLLGSIRTQTEYGFFTVGQSYAINHGPHVSKTSRGEFDPGSQTQLWVTGKFRVCSTVVEEVFRRNGSLEGGEQVLSSDPMA